MKHLDNCYVDTILTIFSSDPLKPQDFKFVGDYIDYKLYFPISSNNGQKTILTAAELLYKYTNLKARINGCGWVDLHQTMIIDSPRHISIIYFALIPEVVDLISGQWYNLEKLKQFELSPEVDFIINNFKGIY